MFAIENLSVCMGFWALQRHRPEYTKLRESIQLTLR